MSTSLGIMMDARVYFLSLNLRHAEYTVHYIDKATFFVRAVFLLRLICRGPRTKPYDGEDIHYMCHVQKNVTRVERMISPPKKKLKNEAYISSIPI